MLQLTTNSDKREVSLRLKSAVTCGHALDTVCSRYCYHSDAHFIRAANQRKAFPMDAVLDRKDCENGIELVPKQVYQVFIYLIK